MTVELAWLLIVKCWQYDINNDGMLDVLICTTEGQLVFVDAFGKLINYHQVSNWCSWSKLIIVSLPCVSLSLSLIISLSLSLSLSVVTVPAVTIAQLCSTDQLVIWVLTIHDSVMYPDKHRMRRPLVATVWTDCVASSAFTNRVWTDLSSEFECVWFHWIGLFQFWLLNRAVELVTSESVTVSQFSTPVLGCTGPHVWLVDSNCS